MTTSNRGTPMLVANGVRFYKEKTFGSKTRWQCAFRKLYKCKAFIRTIDSHVVCTNFRHNHGPPPTHAYYNSSLF